MVRLRPTVLVAGLSGGAIPASQLSMVGVQLVTAGRMTWSKKPVIIRNMPYTAVAPHPAQAAIRALLAQIASKAKGDKGLKNVDGKTLPPAAALVYKWWKENRGGALHNEIKSLARGKVARRTARTAEDNLTIVRRVKADLADKIAKVTATTS